MNARRVMLYCTGIFAAIVLLQFLTYILGSWGPAVPSVRARLIIVLYALVVTGGLFLMAGRLKADPDAEPWPLTWLLQPRVMLWIGLLSTLGVCLHLASKLYFITQAGVDCLAEVRFVWLNRAREGNPLWVELSSKLGHLLSALIYPGCFVSAYALAGRSPEFSWTSCLRATGFFILAVLYATVIISRSTLVLFLLVCTAGLMLGVSRKGLNAARLGGVLAAGGVAAGVVILISLARFESTLSCVHSGDRSEVLAIEQQGFNSILPMRSRLNPSNNPYWHIKSIPSGFDLQDKAGYVMFRIRVWIEKACATCSMAGIYLNHGIWNFEWIVETGGHGSSVMLKPLYAWVGLDPSEGEQSQRQYGAGGLTLPGAAYHDLGLAGAVGSAVLLPLLLGISVLWLRSRGALAALGVISYVGTFVVLGWSFIFHGWSVMAFPFVMAGMAAPFLVRAVQKWPRTIRSPASRE